MATNTSESTTTWTCWSCDCHVTNLFGLEVVLVVIVAQSAIASFAPREESALVGDASAVGGATGGIHHKVAGEVVHQVRGLQVTGQGRVAQCDWHHRPLLLCCCCCACTCVQCCCCDVPVQCGHVDVHTGSVPGVRGQW